MDENNEILKSPPTAEQSEAEKTQVIEEIKSIIPGTDTLQRFLNDLNKKNKSG